MRPDAPTETKAAFGGSSLSDKPQAERETAKSATGGTIWAATVSAPCFPAREDCIVAFVTCAARFHVNDGSARPSQDSAAARSLPRVGRRSKRYACVHTIGFTADVNSRTFSGLEWRAGDIACGTRLFACQAQPFRLSSCCCERRGSRPRARVWEPSREQPAVSLN